MSQAKAISSDDVLVRSQPTPNPSAIKFIVNHALKAEGKATFSHPLDGQGLPLVESLFAIMGVKQLYLFQNTLTVTHSGELSDEYLEDSVISVIKSRLPIHNANFILDGEEGSQKKQTDRSHLSPELQQIEEILDRTIRPGLQADGGDIEVLDFIDNELRILYMGACGGCPSAMMGTLDAIQNILRNELDNPVLKVRPT